MLVPLGIWRARGAVVLASLAAISLTALSAGMVPALAEPVTTTTVEVVPTEEVVTEVPTTVEAPPTTQAPVVTQAPQIVTTQAPVVTQAPEIVTTQAPVVTQAPEIVTTQAPVVTQAPEIVTTTAAPIPTPVITTEAEPTPTGPLPTATGPLPTPTGPLPTATGALPTPTGPLPTPTGALPTATGALPTPTGALPTPTGALPTPTGPLPTPTGPLPTATGPLPTPTGPLPTATGPLPTATEPLPTGTTAATTTAVQGAQVTPLEEPQRVEAAPQDVQVAKASVPVEQEPPPAPQSEIDSIKDALNIPVNSIVTTAPTPTAVLTSNVKQWQPDWVQYDEFYRPVIFNPYREPLQIVYLVAGAPRVLVIQPLASIVTEVAQLGAYSFTAMVLSAVGIPTNVAVGTFLGGGYVPGPGQPPPAPPPVKRYDDVPVVVKYAKAEYKPFRVQKIIDVGPDPSVGEHKVLLDGVTPAWGEWKQTETGAQQFEVHKTQSFPGMEEPQEGPLPGDYPLQLVSDSSPTGLGAKDVALIGGAAVVALLAIGAIVFTVFLGRRRPQH